ncbi:MAG: hypothetical protein K5989_04250, partial [Lachnospiraceae bacterium]|nr:hypothetical protein [Lachnospiraceae bacterium]
MLQTMKLNVLIPLEYNKEDYEKSGETDVVVTRKQAEAYKEEGAFNSYVWFHYCFRNKPIEANYQNVQSPLLINESYRMNRIELNSFVRAQIGLHHNEDTTYCLTTSETKLHIGKIRLLFTKSRIAFLHMEMIISDLLEKKTLEFLYAFSHITSRQPQLQYKKKISRDEEETVQIFFRNLIENIVNLQSYLRVGLYEGRIDPFFQITMIGSIINEDKLYFFNSVRALSKRSSSKPIEENSVYEGIEPYISRYVGDKTLCIFGDTDICGKENMAFLTDIGNGLAKTATENYLTAYAYYLSLHLLAGRNDIDESDIDYLLNAPHRVSDEDNIREFLKKCLWEENWQLEKEILNIRSRVQTRNGRDGVQGIADLKDQFARQHNEDQETFGEISQRIGGMDSKVTDVVKNTGEINAKIDKLLKFVTVDLGDYLKKEKAVFKEESNKAEEDSNIAAFTKKVRKRIDEEITGSGDDIVKLERDSLQKLFGAKWKFLMPSTQTSMVSAGVLLKRCADINTPDFDYSGISICATAALEAELRKVFFDGLIKYMIDKYGEPNRNNAVGEEAVWPDQLLQTPKYMNKNPKIADTFTMGKFPYLFGYVGQFSDNPDKEAYQMKESELMKGHMADYLMKVVDDSYNENPFKNFYNSSICDKNESIESGCFVWKCEKIRKDYRNKAAHTDVMTVYEAANCYQSVIRKPERSDVYSFNSEITGVILELYTKINGEKLDTILNSHTAKSDSANLIKNEAPTEFSEGQIVELTNLEITSRGSLRGLISNTEIGAALSKKYLDSMEISADSLLSKNIKVRLLRWDMNAGK